MFPLAVLFLPVSAESFQAVPMAVADPDKGKEDWDGSVELSASTATGNTENMVLGARFDARRIYGRYAHDMLGAANFARARTTNDAGEQVDATTQQNWFVQYRIEVQTGDRTFLYGRTKYERDEFSGFEHRAFAGAGIGHTLVENDAFKWRLLGGPGVQYTVNEIPETPGPDFEETVTELALFAGSDIGWTIRENVGLEHDLDVTWTEDNTSFVSLAALRTDITETIATRVSWQVKHETAPREGRKATDTQLRASIAYGF